jgi:hypothetical protein
VIIGILALVMILYDRMHRPYVRALAKRTVIVEKSKLNLLVCKYFFPRRLGTRTFF